MTNITSLDFNETDTIYVVKVGETYTYTCSQIDFGAPGVVLDYIDNGTTYRTLVPWHMIDRIFQEA